MTDWRQWHRQYEDPASQLSQRLAVVQARIRDVVDTAPPGPVQVVSICAGDGRDLVGALADHPRRSDVRGRLVELDAELAARGRAAAWDGLDFVNADAALTDAYAGAVPAELVLACGVFGNITDADIATTVRALTSFTATGGTVIWTRHRRAPDLFPTVDGWFAEAGFERVWLSTSEHPYGVGVHRFAGVPEPLPPGRRLFTFVR